MQSVRAAAHSLARILGRTLPRTPAADTHLTVQQASDRFKQLRQRDALQPRSDRPSMSYPAMVIGFLQVCTPHGVHGWSLGQAVRRYSGLCMSSTKAVTRGFPRRRTDALLH